VDLGAADDGDERRGSAGGCRVFVASIATMARDTASAAASQTVPPNTCQQAAPTSPEMMWPPTRFRGWANDS